MIGRRRRGQPADFQPKHTPAEPIWWGISSTAPASTRRWAASTLIDLSKELRGPRDEELIDMTRRLVARNRRRLVVLPIPLVGATRRANNAQARRPSGGLRGTITFDTWLEQQR